MAGSIYGRLFQISTWGESHGKGIGVVIDGCPAGLSLSEEDIQVYLDRRKPGQSQFTTGRKESDMAQIWSGVFEGRTTGTPISILVQNQDQRSRDYGNIMNTYRPGHADYTFDEKYGFRDWDSVLAALGHGGLKEGQVINKLQDAYRKKNPQFATDKDILEAVGKNNASSNGQTGAMAAIKSKSGIVVAGLDDVSVRFSRCCSPVPGDEIIGFVTRGRGVSIHRTDCVNVMNMNEADRQRIIEAEWQVTPDKEENELYDTELVIYAYDRIGVLLDLTRVFTESGITINNVNSRTSKQGIATITIGFAIRSVEALHVLTAKLRQVESVKDIQRTHS